MKVRIAGRGHLSNVFANATCSVEAGHFANCGDDRISSVLPFLLSARAVD